MIQVKYEPMFARPIYISGKQVEVYLTIKEASELIKALSEAIKMAVDKRA